IFRMRERDVEPHPARARRSYLKVQPGSGPAHRLERQLDVPDELREIETGEMAFDGFDVRLTTGRPVAELDGAGEHVLVGEDRRRVHAIDDDLGPVTQHDRAESRPVDRGAEAGRE